MDISLYRSDIQELIKEIGSLRGHSHDATIEKCQELLNYGENRRDDALIGYAHFTMGETYYMMNDMPSCYFELLKCLKPFGKISQWGYLVAVYNLFGIIALNRGNVPMAMDYYYKAYELSIEHKMPELTSRAHMNLGSLYLAYGNPDEAAVHFEESYKYVTNHMDMDFYVETLNAVILGRGKTYLGQNNIEAAKNMKNEIEQRCMAFLQDSDKLIVECFYARLAYQAGESEECKAHIASVCQGFSKDTPIMDVFDDIYDFLSMLLDMKAYSEFTTIYPKVLEPVKATSVKNLEKKMMMIFLRFLKENGMMDEYHRLSEEFIELLSLLETENSLMISSTISLRNEIHKLKEENNKEKKEKNFLKRKSETDPLTGMSNRLMLNEYGEIAFDRAITNGNAFAIELLDIDYFKEYNDNYGHQAGDECLLFIANSIMNISKNHLGVFCSRYGGDEFVIIYEGFAEQEVFNLAKELKNTIVDACKVHEFSKGDVKLVTISQGIYWGTPDENDNIWEYLHEADQLLYKVKKKSRNSIMLGKSKHGESGEDNPHPNITPTKPLITELKEEDVFSY